MTDSIQMPSEQQPGDSKQAEAPLTFAQALERKAELPKLFEAFQGADLTAENFCAFLRRTLNDHFNALPAGFIRDFEAALIRVEEKLAEGKAKNGESGKSNSGTA